MIKTVKKSEVKVLIKMIRIYYQHVCRYENSLVIKFFDVHCVKPIGVIKFSLEPATQSIRPFQLLTYLTLSNYVNLLPLTRFIVMGNLFCSKYRIHR
ncbi:hypothetical protein L6452_20088 [Arctium lappa]|uniref:Uncharacterized protein n=1 Tax=Arctium lappa TaxID=4217 RepID=A0ACB9B9X9_ARCLA|nr:hypothetical protein L6452_20088 [Arctium lappa]